MIWPNLLTLNLPWTAAIVLLGAIEYLMPELTRPEVMFSVTVSPELKASVAGGAIIQGYRRIVGATVVAALIVALTPFPALGRWSGAGAFALQYAGFAVAISSARRKTKMHAIPQSTIREADLGARASSTTLTIAVTIPLVTIGAIALWSYARWNSLPEIYPLHWRWDGEPDFWVPRTLFHVYGLLGLLGGSAALMAIGSFGLMFWSRRPQCNSSTGFDRRFLTATLAVLVAGEYLLAASATLPIGFGTTGAELVIFVILATASIYLMTAGHAAPMPRATTDNSPDHAWKLGVIYFNPSDPAFLVEKRFGLGWTLNFGNRWGWVVIGAALIPMVLGVAFVISTQT
jgi:uncharacterized membrane protein